MIEIIIRGNRIDTDGSTRLGLKFTGGIFRVADNERTRSYSLSVPKTDLNNEIFNFDGDPVMEGVRTSAECVIMGGGVTLNGLVYLQSYGGRRFELLFVEKVGVAMLFESISHVYYPDSILINGKDRPVSGSIPKFGWYQYSNSAADGLEIGTPVNQYPCTNLGYLIEEAALQAGYTVIYRNSGSIYEDAGNYGIILDKMNTYSEAVLTVNGSGHGGFSYNINTGQTLNQIGLSVVARQFKKGLFQANITVYTFTAIRHIKVRCDHLGGVVFSGGVGKPSDWLSNADDWTVPFEMEMDAGDYFTIISFMDITSSWYAKYVNMIGGYETNISQTDITVLDDDGIAAVGETIYLRESLPDLSLADLLKCYCDLTCSSWTVDDSAMKIIVETYEHALANAGGDMIILDDAKIVSVGSVERFLSGFQQHNYVRCKSASYVEEPYKFLRDYPCANEILEEEAEYTEIPFNEGNWHIHNNDRIADFEDVTIGTNGARQYKGVCSMFFANFNGGQALHLQTINDVGNMGMEFAAMTRQAVTVKVSVVMSLFVFSKIKPSTFARWHGRDYIVRTAEWSENVCQLDLVRLEI